MRVVVIVRPKYPPPLDQLPTIFNGFASWRARYRGHMEVFENFAGAQGGLAILNVADEATLNQIMIEFPFTPYTEIEVRPLLDGDVAIEQLQQAFQAPQG